jgi:hypothetical protein
MLVAETNKYYNQYLDTFNNDDRHSWIHDVSVQEMYIFLPVIIQIGHDEWHTFKDYWFTLEQLYKPFFSNRMKWFFHIPRFLHFCNNMNQTDKTDKN